jgi:hypothetical protein
MASSSYTNIWFAPPEDLGATSYTLQTSPDGNTNWTNFLYYYEDLTTDDSRQNNFSVDLSTDTWVRLAITGGQYDGHYSNKMYAEHCSTDSYIQNYHVDESMSNTGIKAPAAGYGLVTEFTVVQEDATVLENILPYQWYRVNPDDWEDVALIDGATALTYITTGDDKGYHLMIKATGDDSNFDGFISFMSEHIVR